MSNDVRKILLKHKLLNIQPVEPVPVVDDYGNISYLANIIFDNKTFPGMKKLPELISSFSTLEGIQIMDIPEFEELPDNLDKSTLYAIQIMNTGFKAFSEEL